MKHLFFSFLFFTAASTAQNLVQNPSFEQHDTCPDNYNELYYASGWNISINTPDYFNTCATNFAISIPSNGNGFQYPATGNAYAGFIGYSQSNIREYLGENLSTPLVTGHKYFVTFKISLAEGDGSTLLCGIDKIGVLFTNIFLGDTIIIPSPFINNFAHFLSNNIISDTSNWVSIRGVFIADSSYQYFIIGHFFDSANTNFSCGDSLHPAYYYLDDVCISEDSSSCDWYPDGARTVSLNCINSYPNPADKAIYFEGNNPINLDCTLINVFGEKVKEIKITDNKIDVSLLDDGIYFLEIKTQDKNLIKKQIIIH